MTPDDMSEIAKCGLCGEPMPPGEEMFQYHGYSCECPEVSTVGKICNFFETLCSNYGFNLKTSDTDRESVAAILRDSTQPTQGEGE